jgi:DNA-binding transcriptional LysR family regulator
VQLNTLDLNKLHAFFAVVEASGITGAAGRLGRTPSAVSQSITGLEGALGVRLFDRVGKRLVLTRSGRHLYRRFRDYQSQLQQTVDELTAAAGDVRGLVRFGLFLGFPRLRLVRFITRFSAHHPNARVRVVYAPQDDLNARLLSGGLDFAVSFHPRADTSQRLTSTKLFRQELVLVSGRRFFTNGFDLAELGQTPVIDYYQSDPLIHRWLAHHFGGRRRDVNVVIWGATTDLVLDLVLDHAGVAVVPQYLAEPYVKRGRLGVLRTGRRELTDLIWLNERQGAYRDRTLDVFRSAVLLEFGGNDRV